MASLARLGPRHPGQVAVAKFCVARCLFAQNQCTVQKLTSRVAPLKEHIRRERHDSILRSSNRARSPGLSLRVPVLASTAAYDSSPVGKLLNESCLSDRACRNAAQAHGAPRGVTAGGWPLFGSAQVTSTERATRGWSSSAAAQSSPTSHSTDNSFADARGAAAPPSTSSSTTAESAATTPPDQPAPPESAAPDPEAVPLSGSAAGASGSASGPSSDRGSREETRGKDEEIRRRIQEAALAHVAELGWTVEALAAGAKSLGYSAAAHGVCARGGIDLVRYFIAKANRDLARKLAASPDLKTLRMRDRLLTVIRTRLELVIPVIGTWPQALALQARPEYAAESVEQLAILSDEMWHLCGDSSVDISWYTKRLLVSGVYGASELYMLTDYSDEFQDTWAFVERRIDDALVVGKALGETIKASSGGLSTVVDALGSVLSSIPRPRPPP